jgi:protein O-GlcNAc transferase
LQFMVSPNQLAELQAAMAYEKAGRLSDAATAYKRLLQQMPGNFGCVYSLAMIYAQQGNFESAADMFRRATQIRPGDIEVRYNFAVALSMSGQHKQAAANYQKILKTEPQHISALNNYAATLLQQGRFADALRQYDELIRLKPHFADVYNNRGMTLQNLARLEDALRDYDKAIALKPDFAEAYVNRGNALAAVHRPHEALVSFNRAISLRPDLADAYRNAGNIYSGLGSYTDALASYDRALALQPSDWEAKSMRLNAKLHLCDWDGADADWSTLIAGVAHGTPVSPFVALAVSSSSDELLQCARVFCRASFPVPEKPLWRGKIYRHDRIRLCYLSTDFREHAIGYLVAGLFEQHDRSRFEVTALSFGGAQESPLRERIARAADQFISVRDKSDQEIAELLLDLEIDVAIDLMGYTQNARSGVFARRPTPIQVSYLGYLGTMGADFMDYIIGDGIALPLNEQRHYSEKIVHLPDCFLINDDQLAIAPHTPTRADAGLPEDAFVFCSFNNSYKLQRRMFELWMRLLHATPGSVLWLAEANTAMAANLKREAQRCGIDSRRLVFAPRLAFPEHLARQRLADLFLDTVPYNAGATAAAALWSGVPVLTVIGTTFVGRMAASMLHTIGLPELATPSLPDYEALALRIAADPALCASLRDKLSRNRENLPLFDTERSTRNLERAYTAMWHIYQNREHPRNLTIETAP